MVNHEANDLHNPNMWNQKSQCHKSNMLTLNHRCNGHLIIFISSELGFDHVGHRITHAILGFIMEAVAFGFPHVVISQPDLTRLRSAFGFGWVRQKFLSDLSCIP